jgi:hypothetical protein
MVWSRIQIYTFLTSKLHPEGAVLVTFPKGSRGGSPPSPPGW